MKQKNKELLLKYLCMALPYGVKILHEGWDYDRDCEFSSVETLIGINDRFILTLWGGKRNEHSIQEPLSIIDYKPFLRPMSTMTKEEKIEFSKLLVRTYCEEDWEGHVSTSYGIEINNVYTDDANGIQYPSPFSIDAIDWLNTYHFDFMDLISKGLAIAVTKENNPYDTKDE